MVFGVHTLTEHAEEEEEEEEEGSMAFAAATERVFKSPPNTRSPIMRPYDCPVNFLDMVALWGCKATGSGNLVRPTPCTDAWQTSILRRSFLIPSYVQA